ncbi:YbjN domain-containing protein [Amylibacter sp.]|nr:YbjN domain-containing protein [Amylibacter sp.]
MADTKHYLSDSEIHPIDIVENLIKDRSWDFDRVGDDQIAMMVEGKWRTYSVNLAWSAYDETLRLISSFDMDPPKEKLPELFEALNLANDDCWTGGFSYWKDHKMMVFRYGLVLSGGAIVSVDQIDHLLHMAATTCERYYPAFQLACWGDQTPSSAMDVAIAEAYGHA